MTEPSLKTGVPYSAALACAAVLALAGDATGQTVQATRVASGLSSPLYVTAPAGDSRLFIVEKGGLIRVQQSPGATPTTFLDLTTSINASGERGLLGLAFDPNYATNGRFYVDYIDAVSLNTRVVRYTVPNPATANTAAGAVVDSIITVNQPAGRSNHKAGWIGFRPGEAGNLYVAVGDGGSSNDPDQFAQNINSNLGKMLRLDVSGNGVGYAIPAGNPFAGATPGNDEIWAYGLRNPFRNSFDRANGNFYIADVGQSTREEVNVEETSIAGRNYGWRAREGSGDNPGVADAAPPNAVDPVFDYRHGNNADIFSPAGVSGSITGGYVYRGNAMPGLAGTYFFGDFVSGKLGSFIYDPATDSVSNIIDRTGQLDPGSANFGGGAISSFGEDGFGELYIVDINGEVFKIVPEPGGVLALSLAGLCALRRRRG